MTGLFSAFSSFIFVVVMGATISGCTVRPLYDDDELSVNLESNSKSKNNTNSTDYGNIAISPIPNRDGQKLRSYLRDHLRNVRSSKMYLKVDLDLKEKSFALDSSGGAHRILATYNAHVILSQYDNKKNVMERTFSVSNTYNIARAQGEVMLSLYGRNDFVLLKELARRICEGIKMSLIN